MKALAALAGLALALAAGTACAQDEAMPPLPNPGWSFSGVFGTYDRGALQRGFEIYSQICANCHSMKLLAYRDLEGPEGLGYTEEEVKAIAAQKQVTDGPNDQGQMFQRPARPSDSFVSPFPNEQAARYTNNGALPPDLSLIVKARAGGENYIYGILTGYQTPPSTMKMTAGMQYDEYFPGHQIAMPPPLADGMVTYADATPTTLAQEAHDVVTFLTWASEPKMEERKRAGFKAVFFLLVMTGLLYATKRKIWSDLH